MPEPRKPRADALRSRELILDAAAVVLARDAAASLTDIAEEAGVSRATIYRHFSDVAAVRDALLDDIKVLAADLFREHLAEIPRSSASLSDELVRVIRLALPMQTRYTGAMAREPQQDAGLITSFSPLLAIMIKQAQGRSEVRGDLDPEIISESVIAACLVAARRVHRDGVEPGLAIQGVAALLRGIEASPRPL